MRKTLLDWSTKRTKNNALLWKDKIIVSARIDLHNYGATAKIMTKNNWQVFFTINNEDILKLIVQKEKEHNERVKELNKKVNEYLEYNY